MWKWTEENGPLIWHVTNDTSYLLCRQRKWKTVFKICIKFAISASYFSLPYQFPLLLHYHMLTQFTYLNIKFTLIILPPVKDATSFNTLKLLQLYGISILCPCHIIMEGDLWNGDGLSLKASRKMNIWHGITEGHTANKTFYSLSNFPIRLL